MELNKIHKTEQPLLKRSEVVYKVAADGTTPSRVSIVQALSHKEKGTIVVTHIYPTTGDQSALVHARVYSDAAVAAKLERVNLLAKQQPKVEKTEAEASA